MIELLALELLDDTLLEEEALDLLDELLEEPEQLFTSVQAIFQ